VLGNFGLGGDKDHRLATAWEQHCAQGVGECRSADVVVKVREVLLLAAGRTGTADELARACLSEEMP